jgi:DNA helicase HerA-like ATPase
VISLQNCSEIPDGALKNFGTKIALRQQSIKEAIKSTEGMPENTAKEVMNLSPGEFFIKYPSGEYTFLAKGFMSPFQLRR